MTETRFQLLLVIISILAVRMLNYALRLFSRTKAEKYGMKRNFFWIRNEFVWWQEKESHEYCFLFTNIVHNIPIWFLISISELAFKYIKRFTFYKFRRPFLFDLWMRKVGLNYGQLRNFRFLVGRARHVKNKASICVKTPIYIEVSDLFLNAFHQKLKTQQQTAWFSLIWTSITLQLY